MSLPYNNRIIPHLRFLEKTQWWTPSELEKFQKKRLRLLINHAYKNTPYYHKLFNTLELKPQNIKNFADLQQLPILTKEIIKNNFNELTSQNYTKDKPTPSATSGSTGEPMRFLINRHWRACNMAAAYREWTWTGYKIGDRMAYLWSSSHDISQQAKLKAKLNNFLLKTIYLDALNMTEKRLGEYIETLKNFKPKVINAYASAIYLMAQYMKNKYISDIQPRAILTSCETLFHNQRKVIENAFSCEVFDYYSGRETTFHAGECPEHKGYHMSIENAVVEFIKNNESVSQGEFGKIILTDLSNYAMPLIRYEIGDLGKPSDEQCPCGRGLPLMTEISGRIRDIIITKDGKYIPGAFFSMLFYDSKGETKGIKQYQFIQKTTDYAILKIIKGEDFSQTNLENIIEKIREKCKDMVIETEFVNVILPTSSGKYRSTISEVDINV